MSEIRSDSGKPISLSVIDFIRKMFSRQGCASMRMHRPASHNVVWIFSIRMYRMTVGEMRMETLRQMIEACRIVARFHGSASNYNGIPWKRIDLPANGSSHIESQEIA